MENLLEALRDEELPPSRVDVERAMVAGRRVRRTRLSIVSGASLALAVVVALIVPGVFGGAAPPPPADFGGPQIRGETFPVTHRYLTLAPVPGLTVESIVTARHWQEAYLTSETHVGEVVVYPKGAAHMFMSSTQREPKAVEPAAGEPTEPVRGHRAFWLRDQALYQYRVQRLAWEWAPGSWAFAAVGSTDEAAEPVVGALREAARELALATTVGDAGPVKLPFAPPEAPAGSDLTATSIYRGTRSDDNSAFVMGSAFYSDQETGNPCYGNTGPGLEVTIDTSARPTDKQPPNTRVAGYPAALSGVNLWIFYGDGRGVLELSGASEKDMRALGTALRPVANASDESTWLPIA